MILEQYARARKLLAHFTQTPMYEVELLAVNACETGRIKQSLREWTFPIIPLETSRP
jgi:hypothetical protein